MWSRPNVRGWLVRLALPIGTNSSRARLKVMRPWEQTHALSLTRMRSSCESTEVSGGVAACGAMHGSQCPFPPIHPWNECPIVMRSPSLREVRYSEIATCCV